MAWFGLDRNVEKKDCRTSWGKRPAADPEQDVLLFQRKKKLLAAVIIISMM